MKKLFRFLSTLVLVAMSTTTPAAEENGFYAGAALGRVEPDFSDANFTNSAGNTVTLRQEFDRAALIRLSGGYNWGGLSLELSYEHTLMDGNFVLGNTSGDFEYGNFTAAGVYRGSSRLYPLIKLGLSKPDIDTSGTNSRLQFDTSAFVGAGLGYRMMPDLSVEFDFTRSGDDTSAFMLGLRKHF